MPKRKRPEASVTVWMKADQHKAIHETAAKHGYKTAAAMVRDLPDILDKRNRMGLDMLAATVLAQALFQELGNMQRDVLQSAIKELGYEAPPDAALLTPNGPLGPRDLALAIRRQTALLKDCFALDLGRVVMREVPDQHGTPIEGACMLVKDGETVDAGVYYQSAFERLGPPQIGRTLDELTAAERPVEARERD